MAIQENIDILLTHEAPLDIGVKKAGKDLGKEQVNQIIDCLNPRIVFFGHHHRFSDTKYNGVRVMGLDMPHHSYLRLDTESLEFERVTATLRGKIGYKYDWENK